MRMKKRTGGQETAPAEASPAAGDDYVSAKEVDEMKYKLFAGLEKDELEDPEAEGFEQMLVNLANMRG